MSAPVTPARFNPYAALLARIREDARHETGALTMYARELLALAPADDTPAPPPATLLRISAPPPGERVRIELEGEQGRRLAQGWADRQQLADVLADNTLMIEIDADLWPLPPVVTLDQDGAGSVILPPAPPAASSTDAVIADLGGAVERSRDLLADVYPHVYAGLQLLPRLGESLPTVNPAGYLACGCHGDQRNHTCGPQEPREVDW